MLTHSQEKHNYTDTVLSGVNAVSIFFIMASTACNFAVEENAKEILKAITIYKLRSR